MDGHGVGKNLLIQQIQQIYSVVQTYAISNKSLVIFYI